MKLPSNLSSPNLKLPKPKLGGPSLKLPSAKSLAGRKLSAPKMKFAAPSLKGLSLGRRGAAEVVGLDIQPGFVAAVEVRVNGAIVAARAATVPLPPDTMRDGEVLDEGALADALRELFADSHLGKRVRVGVANQRTVLRTLELPPVTDQKELAAAVSFQAQDQVPMPLGNAVLDFHPLGITDTPGGPRQRVVLVAAQRDMVEKLLAAVRAAGLTPEGVDLSAFALIRSLYRHEADQDGRVLYLNVDGLSNLAIAEGTVCRFTRVVGSGLEGMASELAERRGIALADARARIAEADMTQPPLADAPAEPAEAVEPMAAPLPDVPALDPHAAAEEPVTLSPEEAEAREREMTFEELSHAGAVAPDPEAAEPEVPAASDADVWAVLDNGIREISGEVRNSIDFHRSQDGGQVSHIVLSGAAEDIPGFAEALQASLGVEVRPADARCRRRRALRRLAPPPGRRSRPRDRGGAAPMRAVNLIPGDQRSGGSVGSGRSEGAAYAVLALLAIVALLAVLYGKASRDVSNDKAKAATITAEAASETQRAEALAPYTTFVALREQRANAVDGLVDTRFDWAHAFHEFGRVLSGESSITSLSGSIGAVGATSSTSAAHTAGSATPSGSVPVFDLTGCAKSQRAVADTLQRLRLIDGVSEVTLQSSTKSGATGSGSSAGAAGGCPGGDPVFAVTVTFDALPSATASAAAATSKSTKTVSDPAAPAATGAIAPTGGK